MFLFKVFECKLLFSPCQNVETVFITQWIISLNEEQTWIFTDKSKHFDSFMLIILSQEQKTSQTLFFCY